MTVCKRVISVMMCVAVIIGTMIIVRSYLSVCEGGYMRVYVDKNYVEKKDYTEFKTVYIEYYDEKLNILSKKSIEPELPIWGGFYAALSGRRAR